MEETMTNSMEVYNDSNELGLLNSAYEKCFIIAEIGQNHQGDINVAKKLINAAKDAGANCVKFQKSDLTSKFTSDMLNRPYDSPNSFGTTYGEHKKALEFSNEEFIELKKYADNVGIAFSASAMDVESLNFLQKLKLPFIKVGSGDVNNFLLLSKAAETGIPLVISTGMSDIGLVEKVYDLLEKYHLNFALLHCVSSYPVHPKDVNLEIIRTYKEMFPDILIGYSGHEEGTVISVSAVAMGAQIIERHITLDKTQKGTDHVCSLEPEEFKKLVNDIRNVEIAVGIPFKEVLPCEQACIDKLGKTIVAARDLQAGVLLQEEDLDVKVSLKKGINPSTIFELVGRGLLKESVSADEPILYQNVEILNVRKKRKRANSTQNVVEVIDLDDDETVQEETEIKDPPKAESRPASTSPSLEDKSPSQNGESETTNRNSPT